MKNPTFSGLLPALLLLAFISATAQQSTKSFLTTDQYQELLREYFDENGPGASILVAKKGALVYQGAIGKANLELNVPMETKHLFQIASLTKQFTAVATLILMEWGELDLQDNINKYLTDYPTHGHTITIEQLLTHTSGIPNISDLPAWSENLRQDLPTEKIINHFKAENLEFSPGSQEQYSNSGYILLGAIIEKVSGMSYAQFIQKYIFDKAGMQASYYGSAQQLIPNRATGYQLGHDGYENAPYFSMNWPFSAGALVMNTMDLFKWHRALEAGLLIKKETLALAHTPYRLKNGTITETGLGWGIGRFFGHPSIEHSGSLPGFLATAAYLPLEEVFVAIFTNCDCRTPEPLLNKILGIESGHYTPKAAISISPSELEELKGIYENREGQRKHIGIKAGQLTFQQEGGQVYNIYPFEKDRFYFQRPSDHPEL